MTLTRNLPRKIQTLFSLACGLLPLAVFAQTAPPPSVDAATLAKYDTNHNGVLDPDEVQAMQAAQASNENSTAKDVITLSPFQVDTSKDSGYYAENTLAGSRLKTNISDLAAAITVVTKQQLEDTASLNINDVFRYEANTEGSSRYTPSVVDRGTAKDTISGYSLGNDGSTTTNAGSNRLRGLAAPDASIDYFNVNARIPFDSYNTQSVEIARGPNPLLFGLGSPAGIVNQTSTQAALNKNTNEVELRTDSHGSYRGSLGINRTIIKDKLSLFAAFLYDNEQFQRKPSYDLTRREFGAITYKPFKRTIIRGFAEGFLNRADDANSIAPRDFVTPWLQAGRPAYDPVSRTVTQLDSGRVVGPYTFTTLSPGYIANAPVGTGALTSNTSPLYVQGIINDDISRPLERISGANGQIIDYFQRQPLIQGASYVNAFTNPAQTTIAVANAFPAQDPRFAIYDRMWTASNNNPIPTANINGNTYTYGTYNLPGVTDSKIYNWRKYNINQTNTGKLRASNYKLEVEQEITPDLFFSAGWLRQDIDSVSNYTLSQLTGATLTIDTNVNQINGQPNPYFGKVFVGELGPDTFYNPETDDNYRALLAYTLDLPKYGGFWRSLGKHRFFGLLNEQDVKAKTERWRQTVLSGDADASLRYTPNPTLNNGYNLWNSQNVARHYYLSNPGDRNGVVTQGSGNYNNRGFSSPFNTNINVYNYNTGAFQNDQVQLGEAFADNGSFVNQREVKSWNLGTQSTLWDDRIIATLGLRRDVYRARKTTGGIITKTDGTIVATALAATDIYHYGNGQADYNLIMNRYNRWDKLDGYTKTLGAAIRPLKDWDFTKKFLGTDSPGYEVVNSLTLYLNKSDNFNPPGTFATDYFAKPLPKPTGKGQDVGFGFAMLKNKLVARINFYRESDKNERTAAASTLLSRLAYPDTTFMLPWAADIIRIRSGINPLTDTQWNSDIVHPLTTDQVAQQYAMLKLPTNYYAGTSIAGTQDSVAKGTELNLTYNPVPNWTLKVTGSKQATIYNNVAPQYDAWLAYRLPTWLSATANDIPDFVDASGTQISMKNFWTSYGYTSAARITDVSGNTNVNNYFNVNINSQVATAKALQGAVAADQRTYHSTFLTNYVVPRGKLKGFSFGGAESYESRAALGYFGKVGDPVNSPTVISVTDVTRPVYDNPNYYTDLWIAYSRKLYHDRVAWKLQLNCNNITEDGHLAPTNVNFDGKPWAFRIVDSRSFVLTSSFNF